jgi:phenylpyruvate tautomerase PptA (4-oxalocrotonate tautomerase family)
MPLVCIDIEAGFDRAYKQAILDGVHQALVEAIHIPDHDRRQRLCELPAGCFEHEGRSEKYTIVEITMYQGRSAAAKKALYAAIVRNLEQSPGIAPNDVSIVIHDLPLENWGVHGGKPASEVQLGFKIDV